MQIKDLTTDELKRLIRETVIEALEDYLQDEDLPDPDAGKDICPEVVQQLLTSRQRRAAGTRGVPATEVAQRFGLTWQ